MSPSKISPDRNAAGKECSGAQRVRKRPGPGWIPNYHGAWAMITIPVFLGIILGGFVWEHLLLLGLWWIGYFAFFATSMWLRSRRQARYFPPVRAYGLATVPFAIGVLVAAPHLVRWLPVYAPLIAIAAWASTHRKDRSMVNNIATVGAACLTLPVAFDMGPGHGANWPQIWLTTLVVTCYFLGTVLYVKTNIRERGEIGWLAASILFHGLATVCVVALAAKGLFGWWLATLWVAIFLRATLVPIYGKRERWLSVKVIGLGELAFSVALFLAILATP